MGQNYRQSSIDPNRSTAMKAKGDARWADIVFMTKVCTWQKKSVLEMNLDEAITVVDANDWDGESAFIAPFCLAEVAKLGDKTISSNHKDH